MPSTRPRSVTPDELVVRGVQLRHEHVVAAEATTARRSATAAGRGGAVGRLRLPAQQAAGGHGEHAGVVAELEGLRRGWRR